jgi:hypothetical protein
MSERVTRLAVRDERTGCLIWTSGKHRYPHVSIKNKTRLAHRAVYEEAHGPIPEGLTIDHLCGNPRCVEITHLEAVSCRVNLLRSESTWAGRNSRKTHCPQGHEYDRVRAHDGARLCSTCAAEHQRRYRQKKKERAN